MKKIFLAFLNRGMEYLKKDNSRGNVSFHFYALAMRQVLSVLFQPVYQRIKPGKFQFHRSSQIPIGAGIVFLIFILSIQFLSANNIEITNRKYLYTMNSGTPSTYTSAVLDPDFDEITGSTATFRDNKAVGYLQLGIDPGTLACYSDYRRIEVTFNITYTLLNSWGCTSTGSVDTSRVTDIQTLTIDFDPANQQVYTEQARLLFNNAYFVKVEVATVTMYDLSSSVVFSGTSFSTLPMDLFWEVGLQIERYDDFDYTAFPTNFELSLDGTSDEIVFNWDYMAGAEYYEIEFSYVNDYSATNLSTQLAAGAISATFKNNATKIRLNNTTTTYRIPDAFDRGFVLARIRGVGKYSDDLADYCNLSNEIYGTWSFENTPSTPFVLNTMNSDHYMAVNRHEGGVGKNKNWKLSASYAEEGKHKEIVEYADGSSRVRQSVTKLSTTNEAIIGETAYDYQGRPTVQILPVPINNSRIKYYDNFNLEDVTGDKFNREHFDDDAVFTSGCIPTPPMLQTTSGSSYYYSTSNSLQTDQQAFVADAEKYPYTQVVYTPDNTGRIKMQSGVGANHILGSGHETKYFYGKPSQVELDRLFGSNVGYKSHYQKNMVMDANGQVSISFLDMAGKTIATSLAGEPPANLNALVDDANNPLYTQLAETLSVKLLGDLTANAPNGEDNHLNIDGTVWSSTTPLLVEKAQIYTLYYSVDLVDYLDECLIDVCLDCMYDLEIKILDGCNNPIASFPDPFVVHLGGEEPDTICNEDNSYSIDGAATSSFNADLEVGNYTLVKTLSLNEDVIGYYTEKYIANDTCLLDWDDFFQMPDTSGCFYSCEDCLEALGDSSDFYDMYDSSGMSLEELRNIWWSKKAACDKICDDDENDMCKAGYNSMLRDMTPGGQYALFNRTASNVAISPDDKLSIFYIDPFLPDFTNTTTVSVVGGYPHDQVYHPPLEPWRNPHFFDKDHLATYTASSNEFYFDENGAICKIYLDQDGVGNWLPHLVGSAPIMTDANGSYTYPQYLQSLDDFISRFQPSWAKSLLVYHPEFLFMKECFTLSEEVVTIGGTDYNTWGFDKLITDLTYATSGDAAGIMPGGYGSTFDLREQDPFFTNHGSDVLLGAFTVNNVYDFFADNMMVLGAETLDVFEYVNGANHCDIGDPGLTSATLGSCMIPGFNNVNKSLYIAGQGDWDRLVSSYQSFKQDAFTKEILLNILNYHLTTYSQALTNQCIGAVNYNAGVGAHALDPWMPCDLVEYTRYAHKDVRFGLPNAIYNNGIFDPAPPTPEQLLAYAQQQVYITTGKCPAAIDLQTLLYGLLHTGDLTASGLVLDTYTYLMPVLEQKLKDINGGVVPNYTGTIGTTMYGEELLWNINLGNYLSLTLPAGYSWADAELITNVDDVSFTGTAFQFTAQAQILNTTTNTIEWIEAVGITTIQIGGCETEIPVPCTVTAEAKDLNSLIGILKQDGHLNASSYTLTSYYSYITPSIQGYLGAGSAGDFVWNNPSSGVYTLTNTSSGDYLTLTIDPGDITTFSTGSFQVYSIAGDLLTSTFTTTTSGFSIFGYTNLADQLFNLPPDVEVQGDITVSAGVPAFIVSNCQVPLPIECNTEAHQNYIDFLNVLETDPFPGTECMSALTDMQGAGASLPAGFSVISLDLDYAYSTDQLTSTHFFLIYSYLSGRDVIIDTVKGAYCEPIRKCIPCHQTADPVYCNKSYLFADMGKDLIDTNLIDSGAVLQIRLSVDLQGCNELLETYLTFDPSTMIPGGPYTTEHIFEVWADTINNNSDGTFSAYHFPGSHGIVISLDSMLLDSCPCNPYINSFFDIVLDEDVRYELVLSKNCCSQYVPPPCTEAYLSFDYTGLGLDTMYLDSGYVLSIDLTDEMEDCFDSLNVRLTYTVPANHTLFTDAISDWVDWIHAAGAPNFDAFFELSNNKMIISLTDLDMCLCNYDEFPSIHIRDGDTTIYSGLISKTCCQSYKPIGGGGKERLMMLGRGMEEPGGHGEEPAWEPQTSISLTGPCDVNLTPFPVPPPTGNPCVEALIGIATQNANNAYNEYLDSVRAAFRAHYIAECMAVTEDFRAEFINQQYHFTLYYYDQAGNLVKTVPPKAVRTITVANLSNVTTARNGNTGYVPEHDDVSSGGNNYEKLTTKYVYNTLNQPRYQKTPDGGQTEFIYDALGRLALSQNAKQFVTVSSAKRYSYTTYDGLGRITEVGQLEASTSGLMTQDNGLQTIAYIPTWIALTNSNHTEITTTVYDEEYTSNPLVVQTELRNRVSYTHYRDAYADPARSSTYYSYDIHGNVKTLWQENMDIANTNNQLKKMVYEYDLVSGKVNRVTFQPEAQDQWIHRYTYDADNRLTNVETSRNDVFYDRDASYFYYKHGPLARTELGELNVQGIDYAYTIHGWLKGINATNLDADFDMGKDGYATGAHQYFGKDAYSYALHYFNDDYKNISANESFIGDVSSITYNSLYNGNIAMMQTTLNDNTITPIALLSNYLYDQLNRLISANYNPDLTIATNTWANSFDNRYKNEFKYDPNGNIKIQLRNGEISNLGMDDLEYVYLAGSNQLSHVRDYASSSYTDDIDNQSGGNYAYDKIGNLVHDHAEEIDIIDWTVYGKVKTVARESLSTKADMAFAYGPGGQRITKTITDPGTGNIINYYYFYDASGNMMGIYKIDDDENQLYLEEEMIYGSSRIGSVKLHEELPLTPPSPYVYTQKRGQKCFELTNHLGNVLTTITDRRKVLVCEDDVTYGADIVNVSDYSAFGAPLAGDRTWNTGSSYRFGFNGMEKVNEQYGEGNAYDFGARIHDPRLGRFLSIDPLIAKMPWATPYCYALNNPIQLTDEEGKGPGIPILMALVKGVAELTNRVAYFSVSMHQMIGVAEAGYGYQLTGTFAADPHGNYAFVGTVGAFMNFGAYGWSTGEKVGIENDGSWFFGASGGFALDIGYYQDYSNVLRLAGGGRSLNYTGPLVGISENLKNASDYNGFQAGYSFSEGVGFGLLDTKSYVFAFTTEDAFNFAEQNVAILGEFTIYKAQEITKDAQYKNIKITYDVNTDGNKTTFVGTITGQDRSGKEQVLSRKVLITFESNGKNTLSTENVSKEDSE